MPDVMPMPGQKKRGVGCHAHLLGFQFHRPLSGHSTSGRGHSTCNDADQARYAPDRFIYAIKDCSWDIACIFP